MLTYGFQHHRSTFDHLINLEVHIQMDQHLVTVFFILKKAYDTTSHYGMHRVLNWWNLRGPLSHFLPNLPQDISVITFLHFIFKKMEFHKDWF
jgi:hypothetical protein